MWVLGDQRLQLCDHGGIPSAGQLGVEPRFEGAQSQLVQAGNLRLSEGLVCELGQRSSPPESERVGQQLRRLLGIARLGRPVGVLDKPFEPIRVDVIRREIEPVATVIEDDHAVVAVHELAAQHLPQA